jgi:5-methylcytosine-specific restriction endonuclease McrA
MPLKRSGIKRGTRKLARVKGLTRKPAKRAARKDTTPPRVRKLTGKRDGRQCARCPAVTALHLHHRRGKGNGGDPRPHTECTCNAILLCQACHAWAHGKGRLEAEAAGYIVSRFELFPGSVSVLIGAGASSGALAWLPCDEGHYSFKDPAEMAA